MKLPMIKARFQAVFHNVVDEREDSQLYTAGYTPIVISCLLSFFLFACEIIVGLEKQSLPTDGSGDAGEVPVDFDVPTEDCVDLDIVEREYADPEPEPEEYDDEEEPGGECIRGLDCEDGFYCEEGSGTCKLLSVCGEAEPEGFGQNFQSETEDLYDECETDGCGTGYCKGDAFECGYFISGQHFCGQCYSCEGATSVLCVAQTAEFSAATALGCTAGDVGCRYCNEGTCTFYVSGHHGCPTCKGCDETGFCNEDLTSFWGSDEYKCTGSSNRCVDGACLTCGEWLYDDGCEGCAEQGEKACWHQAGLNENCNSACGTHGGCVAANWNDDSSCSVCLHFNTDNACYSTSGTSAYCPYRHIYGGDKRCTTRSSSQNQNCGSVWSSNTYQKRMCVCEY